MSQVASCFADKKSDTSSKSLNALEGRYLYCIVQCDRAQDAPCTGIDGNSVYVIPYKDVGAVVHTRRCEPYRSDNVEVVKKWVLQHQEVIDAFCQRFDSVLPAAFDTIIKGTDSKVKEWLSNDYESIKRKLDKVQGKQEFGIQIFWDTKLIADEIVEESAEIKKLSDDMHSKSRGTSYMYRQRLGTLLKRELENRADKYFRNFYEAIKKHVADLRVEKIPRIEDKRMIMNLSCLVSKNKVKELGETLDWIDQTAHFSVRFTGPWPAYSFMN